MKISELTPLAKLVGDEVIALAKAGQNYKIAVSALIESLGPNFKGILPSTGDLPAAANSKRGEIYVISSHFWAYGEDPQNPGTLKWNDLGSFLGPQGIQGIQGIQGLPGNDGTPGKDGEPGKDGKDGTDGKDGRDGMLPDYAVQEVAGETSPDDFYAAVTAAIAMAKPTETVGKSYTVRVSDTVTSKGVWTVMPTVAGRYIWLGGYKALGANNHSTAVIYIPDSTGIPTFLSYVNSEKGDKGEPGPKGADGTNAVGMQVVGLIGKDDPLPDPADFAIGDTYIVGQHFWMKLGVEWVDIGNFAGPAGNDAYQIAVLNGFVGTEQDWLKSLKGADGIGLRIIGSLDTSSLLPSSAENVGDSYIIRADEKMYVWDGTGWSTVGQVGPEGKAGKDAYEIAIDQGFRGTRTEWLASLSVKGDKGDKGDQGIQGIPGKDGTNASSVLFKGGIATQSALPATGNTVSDAWMVEDVGHLFVWTGTSWYDTGVFTAKGEKGDKGDQGIQGIPGKDGKDGVNGKSSYEVAVAAGFTGTDLQWLASLIGPGITPRGTVADVTALANIASPKLGYTYNVIGGDKIGHQYVYDGTNFVDMGDIRGQKGEQGIQGIPGTQGIDGKPGPSLIPKGTVADSSDLLAIQNPVQGWLYSVTGGVDAGHQFVYSGADWIDMGNVRGIQGIQGLKGDKGDIAGAVNFKGVVTAVGNLPSSGNLVSDAYFVGTHLYVWQGASWIDCGSFQGLKGDQGIQGIQGIQGNPGADGKSAYQLAVAGGYSGTEAQWLASLVGAPVFAKGSVADLTALNAVANPVNGWLYNVIADGHMYIRNGSAWVDCGLVRGIQGIQGTQGIQGIPGADGVNGKDGTSFAIVGRVAADADLPASPSVGNGVFVGTTLKIWDGTTWVSYGDFAGPQGIQGPKGDVGAGIKILGKKASTGDLPATGNIGDGYMIGLDFYVWDGSTYVDVGPIQGPKGDQGLRGIQGLQGPKGDKGDPGAKGDQGTIIIILSRDPGVADGRINDYFMSTVDQKLYRKTSDTAWAYLGTFGGGNVYDAPSDGKKYLRVNGAWAEYVAPTIPVGEAPTDGARYYRKNSAWEAFNVYDLKTMVSTGPCDISQAQWFLIDGTKATTVAFNNLPAAAANRGMAILLSISGSGGSFSWPANLKWSGGSMPPFGTTFTLLSFSWDGTHLTGSLSQSY